MTLPRFELLKPATLAEALGVLSTTAGAQPLAGGTNLIVDMRSGKLAPKTLVDIGELQELCCIREKDGHLLIGGGGGAAPAASPAVAPGFRRSRFIVLILAGSSLCTGKCCVHAPVCRHSLATCGRGAGNGERPPLYRPGPAALHNAPRSHFR